MPVGGIHAGEGRAPAAALEAVPRDWLALLPGECLCALHLWVAAGGGWSATPAQRGWLREESLVASAVAEGQGEVYTDFAIHADGFSRMLLVAGALSHQRLGRLVQQLLEIETYRMAALLGLPAAREAGAALASAECELAALAEAIRSSRRDAEPALLDRLTRLAGQVEGQYAATHSRFSASSAYFELVDRRIQDIAESRHRGPADHRRIHGAAPEPRAQHLRLGRAAAERAVRARLAHEQPAAHARGDRAAAEQPGPAGPR
ncbi:hypothetical protein ALISP_6500 [Alicycliphilus sp. B1]|nr:hypothetical protein ALISP_6500 [Alicycliphilus sp. B1]